MQQDGVWFSIPRSGEPVALTRQVPTNGTHALACCQLPVPPFSVLLPEGQRNMPPQNTALQYIILSYRPLKNSKCREKAFSELPYLPKDRSSTRNLVVIKLLPPWEFHQMQGLLTLVIGRQKSTLHPDTLYQKLSYLLSSLLFLPKNHL